MEQEARGAWPRPDAKGKLLSLHEEVVTNASGCVQNVKKTASKKLRKGLITQLPDTFTDGSCKRRLQQALNKALKKPLEEGA